MKSINRRRERKSKKLSATLCKYCGKLTLLRHPGIAPWGDMPTCCEVTERTFHDSISAFVDELLDGG